MPLFWNCALTFSALEIPITFFSTKERVLPDPSQHSSIKQDFGDLLRNADFAMYRAKGAGKGRHELFQARMREGIVAALEVEP